MHSETKGSVYINQYFNDLNIDAHFNSTGPEIWNQTEGKITPLTKRADTRIGGFNTEKRCLKSKKRQTELIQVTPKKRKKNDSSVLFKTTKSDFTDEDIERLKA